MGERAEKVGIDDMIESGDFVPIIVVIAISAGLIVKRVTAHLQEMAKINASSDIGQSQPKSSEIELLRQEIMRLRDTTTQYDISVERTLSEVKNRLDHLESSRIASGYSPTRADTSHIESESQAVGRN